MSHYILGLSAYYHDSAAALLHNGHVIAGAQEERFTRQKHDPSFPRHAIAYCLSQANISLTDIHQCVFYDKPLLKFERLLLTYLSEAPKGFKSFVTAMPIWLKEKLFLKRTLRHELCQLGQCVPSQLPPLLFTQHHQAHAGVAFFSSPFERAAILCCDGVGEWATTSAWMGEHNRLTPLWQLNFPHSLGLLYSAMTQFAGFKVNSGEYKLMGLAPYGEPKYVQTLLDHVIDLKEDGTFRLNMDYFNFTTGLTMNSPKMDHLFQGPARVPESALTQREMDIAASIQAVTEKILLKLAHTLHRELSVDALCLSGGVALNCVANSACLHQGPFQKLWIPPAPADAGSAIGAAQCVWHEHLKQPKCSLASKKPSDWYLGPEFTTTQICAELKALHAHFERLSFEQILSMIAQKLAQGQVIAWFQDRMEFGPRALGNRSILADPRHPNMQSILNQKVKFRESFRPFAPAILAHRVDQWFDLKISSPYMLFVANILKAHRLDLPDESNAVLGLDKLALKRSTLPATTHVDYSARVQTVSKPSNPKFFALIEAFESLTQCPVVLNTSFNIRGEPIVCTPKDAYQCFMHTEIDGLVCGDVYLDKAKQPHR